MTADDETQPPHLIGLPAGGPNRGHRETAHVRANRAVELRMAGATYQQVATALNYRSRSSAYEAVQRALTADTSRISDLQDEYRQLQLHRIERLIRAVWTKAIGGDRDLLVVVLRLLEREAKLLGLDAPIQVTVSEDKRAHITAMLDQLEAQIIGAKPIPLPASEGPS